MVPSTPVPVFVTSPAVLRLDNVVDPLNVALVPINPPVNVPPVNGRNPVIDVVADIPFTVEERIFVEVANETAFELITGVVATTPFTVVVSTFPVTL